MYFPRLDTLRCYAAFMVVIVHIFRVWTWKDSTEAMLPFGQFGVVIFFLLSGFLITRLLLIEPQGKSLGLCFKEFYIRRSLRIFPIYYLFLAIAYFFNISEVQQYGIAPWLYVTNLHIFAHNSWIGPYSHLWTLAVEEQFYLVWPFMVLFLRGRTKALFILFLSAFVLSNTVRAALFAYGFSDRQVTVFSLSSVDFFALGALIALGHTYGKNLGRFKIPALLAGISGYYLSYFFCSENTFKFLEHFTMGATAAGLIIAGLKPDAEEKRNFFYRIFHNKFTIHLGRISYGIYLYHNIIAARYLDILGFFGIHIEDSTLIRTLATLLFTLLVAELSFYFIERPFLHLKKKFRHPRHPATVLASN